MIKINRKIFITAGLSFGDEGKGTTVDYLTRKYDAGLIVRYNGGSQAAHNVVEPNERHHCFSQFGSGMFLPGVKTYLSQFMLINPLSLEIENNVLKQKGVDDAMERLFVNQDCLVVTPFHKIINRMQEISRGTLRHGSCGKGIGQTALDGQNLGAQALRMADLSNKNILKEKLCFLWRMKIDLAEQIVDGSPTNQQLQDYLQKIKDPNYLNSTLSEYLQFAKQNHFYLVSSDYFYKLIEQSRNVIFEGAQGVLLDEKQGFWPHVTKTRTTFINATNLLSEVNGETRKVGILRAFTTRHGSGPFVTEDSQLKSIILNDHNANNDWQGELRVGWFDLILARFGIEISGGADSIALTNLDNLNGLEKIRICKSYQYVGSRTDLLDSYFEWESVLNNKIKITKLKKGGRKSQELTQLLLDCQPFEFIEFEGWTENYVKSKQLQKFIDFLRSSAGLNTPISILSFGPTRADKVEI